MKSNEMKSLKKDDANADVTSFQELYELAQRKILRQLAQFSDKDQYKIYPRLIFIDLQEKDNLERIIKRKLLKGASKFKTENDFKREDGSDNKEILDSKSSSDQMRPVDVAADDVETSLVVNDVKLIGNIEEIQSIINSTQGDFVLGFSVLCENEEGWHKSNCFLPISDVLLSLYSPYLVRIMNLLKK